MKNSANPTSLFTPSIALINMPTYFKHIIQVIRLVGEHMQGKITLSPLVLNESVDVKFSDLFRVLKQRQSAMKLKPQDLNSATHLIRSALGGTAYGVDHGRLSQMLTLPPDMVRMFRDDITVTVIFFDQEFLRHC